MTLTRTMLASSLVLGAVLATGPAAHAAAPDGGRSVERWEATYDLQEDGSADVTVEIDFDFGDEPGHGPYWTLPTRVPYDDSQDRVYDITDVEASSPTGAPAQVHLDEGDAWLAVRVGDEDIADVSGVQTYVLTYTVHHVMNATDAGDEFYWNVIGDAWETPISDVSVTVTGAADADRTACWAGDPGVAQACDDALHDGRDATFSQQALDPGQPLTVAVAYPEGTYDTTPELSESSDLAHAFRLNLWTVGGFLLLLLGGLFLIVRRIRATALDVEYAEFAPGLGPVGGDDAAIRYRDRRTPVAVAFEPPAGLRPGQLGTLIDETADVCDVTATMVDLAVRGYLTIEALEKDEYALTKQRDADDALYPYEQMLFDAIFDGRERVTLSELKTTFHADMAKVQAQLYRNVMNQGWFRSNPSHARGVWGGTGGALLVAGALLTLWLANISTFAVVPLALVVLGIVMIATFKVAPARTPEGSRVFAQTRGFELYLRTAEAEQLRFEEGHDLFSRYLPFAIAFGDAEAWTKKFENLAAQGVELAEPTWFHGYAFGTFWLHSAGFGHQMSQFTALADAAMSAPTPGTSGGSGFSSGGGFSGGGGGGGGGGGW